MPILRLKKPSTRLLRRSAKAKGPMQTQTIYHPAPFRWFPRIQRRLNLVQAGKGARNVRDGELAELRAIPTNKRS